MDLQVSVECPKGLETQDSAFLLKRMLDSCNPLQFIKSFLPAVSLEAANIAHFSDREIL